MVSFLLRYPHPAITMAYLLCILHGPHRKICILYYGTTLRVGGQAVEQQPGAWGRQLGHGVK